MHTHTDHQTLWHLIKHIKFGMLTHRHSNGELHSHPLTTQNKSADEGSQLYFFISRYSEMARQLPLDPNVNMSYADPSKDSYVSLSGLATIVDDQPKKEALFSPMSEAWFPAGATDPNLALLKVEIHHAEYWDVKESKMLQLAKMAKAVITGETPQKLGEHKELNLS